MKTPKNILFIIHSLHGGGAERVVCSMANYWAKKGEGATILTLAGPDVPVSYPLSSQVKKRSLNASGKNKNALLDNVERIKKLSHAIKEEQPDVILSFMEATNILSILAARGLKIPVIVSDRIDPKLYSYGYIWRFLRNITYPFASSFVVQTKTVLGRYPSFLARKATVIPNFVDVKSDDSEKGTKKNIICAMGRLNKQKGFDILLHSFAKVADQFPEWSLVIWGEGEERKNLEKLRDDLVLSQRISFPGFSEKANAEIKNAGLFVLSSRYEGFPNALMEAMACGLPVIATRCLCGPEELIKDDQNGLLIPTEDVDALATAMISLLEDKATRERLGLEAQKVQDEYNSDHIIKMWEDLICAA
ncbi:MAG: glycosyl transferase [Micavibrio sp.]|nr:MAG: glycosyl transferase [Micavibrio sp.]